MLALGVRYAESATREQSMKLHRRHGEALSRHSELASAWVYTPIEDWTTNDVWTYLLSVPSPWSDNNKDLVGLYKGASGECPLVVDTETPSCGNSRFGCWVCTVVQDDHSMIHQVEKESGEWMKPMLEFRDYLSHLQSAPNQHIPLEKKEFRDYRRRDGRVHTWGKKEKECPECGAKGFLEGTKCKACKKNGKTVTLKVIGAPKKGGLIWGPYKLSMRKKLLRNE